MSLCKRCASAIARRSSGVIGRRATPVGARRWTDGCSVVGGAGRKNNAVVLCSASARRANWVFVGTAFP